MSCLVPPGLSPSQREASLRAAPVCGEDLQRRGRFTLRSSAPKTTKDVCGGGSVLVIRWRFWGGGARGQAVGGGGEGGQAASEAHSEVLRRLASAVRCSGTAEWRQLSLDV